MDRAMELHHLRKVDVDIAGARGRIENQRELIERTESAGLDSTTAKSVLATMKQTLSAWNIIGASS